MMNHTLPEHLVARISAKRRDWVVRAVSISLAVVCLVGAGFLIRPLNTIRKERQLLIDPESVRGLPPDIALLGKLGTFRALAIDWAAIRAERLKEEGKTYEAMDLYSTICMLAPRFAEVWVNAAWHMAYNISVLKYTPEERWQWVDNGIRLLRDEGLVYNPKAIAIFRELSWIYWHKIGDFLDDEHLNYKRALAVQMERVLGPPPLALTDEDYFDWFRKIVDAPRDLSEMFESDVEVVSLVSRLQGVGLEPDAMFLDFAARNLRTGFGVADLLRKRTEADSLFDNRMVILTDPEMAEPLDRLLAAVRSDVLRNKLHLDPDWMLELMVDRYGPLDWRNAFSHALYWATRGTEQARGRAAQNFRDEVNAARYVFFTLQALIMRGRITLRPDYDDPFESYIELTPDTRFIPYLYDTYLKLSKDVFGDDPEYVEGMPADNYRTGFVTAMHTWIELLYLEGGEWNREMAENYLAWLRENNPHPNGDVQDRYQVTLHEFVMGEILSQLATYKAASGYIRSLIRRSLKHLSLGQERTSIHVLSLARKAYDYWMVDTVIDINERRLMQSFVVIYRDEIEAFLADVRIAPFSKAMLWMHLQLKQRQMVYDRLAPYFVHLCESQNPPWDPDTAFRMPPGMEEFRLREIEYRGKSGREGVDEGTRHKE